MSRRLSSMSLGRRLSTLFILTAVLYALLGVVLVYQARAQQTLSSLYPVPGNPIIKPVPTGSDDAAVQAFFDYNNLRHVGSLSETYFIINNYWGTMYLAIGISVVILYFVAAIWYSRRRHGGDLYPVEVYNAVISERGNPIDTLSYVAWAILVTYMVYYTVMQLTFGQYY